MQLGFLLMAPGKDITKVKGNMEHCAFSVCILCIVINIINIINIILELPVESTPQCTKCASGATSKPFLHVIMNSYGVFRNFSIVSNQTYKLQNDF